jgi:hypothetical protein
MDPKVIAILVLMICGCSSSVGAFFLIPSEAATGPTRPTRPTRPTGPTRPTEYVYEFIIKEETERQRTHNDWNVHITDVRADGVRVTSNQLEMHEEPEHAKCNSKPGGYECEGDNYGINDPEPADAEYADASWSAWKEGQAVTGTKLLTITMPSKVAKFEMDFFRPKYIPGWTIKENGTEVLSTSKGANKNIPSPITVEYTIP